MSSSATIEYLAFAKARETVKAASIVVKASETDRKMIAMAKDGKARSMEDIVAEVKKEIADMQARTPPVQNPVVALNDGIQSEEPIELADLEQEVRAEAEVDRLNKMLDTDRHRPAVCKGALMGRIPRRHKARAEPEMGLGMQPY